MIELKQNNIWSDSLNSFLNFDEPWTYIDKELHKFICFAGGGGNGGGNGGGGGGRSGGRSTGPLGGDPESKSQSDDTGPSNEATDSLSGIGSGEFGSPIGLSDISFDPDAFGFKGIVNEQTGRLGKGATETFAVVPSLLNMGIKAGLAAIPVVGPFLATASAILGGIGTIGKVTGEQSLQDIGQFAPSNIVSNLAERGLASIDPSLSEVLAADIAEVRAAPTTTTIGSPFAESLIGQTVETPSIPVGTDTIAPARDALSDVAKSVKGGLSELADTIGITNQPSQVQPVSTQSITPTITERSPSGGLVNIIQNPLTVRPQEEILPTDDSEGETRRRIIRRPTGAQTGGGIQNLINQQPSLIDIVNRGMAMPDETIPSQRPEQFIKGQQQPGGLRSTNYYTNAMQPASFYAQPQQVRNYGSIY